MDIRGFFPYKDPPSIAVIGDVCLDLYYLTGTGGAEISAETGLQSYSVFQAKLDLGAACNTAADCASLGARKVDLYGIAGNDCWGGIVLDLLAGKGIGVSGILTQDEDWQTHVFHKIYLGREELPRYDMGNNNRPKNTTVDVLLELLKSRLDEYDCVVVNEQVPSGLHSPYFQEKLAALIEKNRDKVLWFSDCRKLNGRYNFTIHKLNRSEAAAILEAQGVPAADAADPYFAVKRLYEYWGLPVVITLDKDGALAQDESGCSQFNSLHFTKEIDIVGAGDAFLAGLVTALGAGLPLRDAALIGTFSAGVSLGKLFETGRPTAEEVIALAEEGDFNYNSRLARDESSGHFSGSTEIEIIVAEFLPAGGPRAYPDAAIFDHDGTISVLRQGWEEVMYTVMIDAVLGRISRPGSSKKSDVPKAEELSRIQDAVSVLIEKTAGVQTLAQMYRLRDMVLSFGYVKKEDTLSPEEYKAVYNQALLASMEKRLAGLESGRLSTEDLTIKGAVDFLKKLAAAGTKLYLVSGTDEEDVRREAGLLGYAGLFSGGIWGSVGDIKNDPKKIVIRNIITEIKTAKPKNSTGQETKPPAGGGRVVVFGDGPVEMREARKAGLFAVGVLSDEKRRYGRNTAKRERLILGGADALIPDFSWSGELARLCGWE
ncbi:MAG: PfkB family carbohydrate kinase [Treponema sp.]|jgi:bifunctional ADP-heptose synthase (sugar kinase/adenylyltransferase)/phosphoglycolate phosphatase-like HAD superfamily hydrolase|nr:PfkB family carbohydrate kinase [Treponema sp.]